MLPNNITLKREPRPLSVCHTSPQSLSSLVCDVRPTLHLWQVAFVVCFLFFSFFFFGGAVPAFDVTCKFYLGTCNSKLVSFCQCCCHLCYPGEYLRLGTFNKHNWACDCFKLLPIYFDLLVAAAGVVCHRLGLLSTISKMWAVGALSRCSTNFASSSSFSVKPSISTEKAEIGECCAANADSAFMIF